MMMLLGLGLILIALFGAPLFAVIAAGAMLNYAANGIELVALPIEFYRLAEMPVLLAIPLFTFAGYILSESGAPGRLMRLSESLLGWMPGGLAIVSLILGAFFTAFTGASGVTIIALGALLHPALIQGGYQARFSLGLVTTLGSLGLLFAPSLPLILYGVIVQQSNLAGSFTMDQMFLAGIIPGVLMVGVLCLWSFWVNRDRRSTLKIFSFRRIGLALKESIWELPLPFLIFGGIYGGYFAISEAAAVTALYVVLVEVFLLREISLRELVDLTRRSMLLVGGILVILGFSFASTNAAIDAGVPERLLSLVQGSIQSRMAFLLLLNIFLLLLGAVLDIFSALVLVVPILLPIALSYGIDPIHLGIIFLANMQLGYLTPPIGMNLFIASYRFESSILTIYRSTIPFFLLLFLTVLVLTYVPALSHLLLG
ncbi:TRAP transporter large permease [Desulfobaculum bizertense]|uniref:TRAP transporter, DctM subunit n=1 Tax=Desulfobaculum bizertense DSM 18034 TaxID=1121442 RepID=A0A1T4W818_9BACT|nr:TRAP transporter large permease [Desulfobaculum bizertense]UIJ39172.1 TRAP transporter large permease [Desulfobaculum bizertense]SKA73423.1 TRAP transporter, DctM subunit [Desulfobaculum bizertense DSM 18034]